jgi:8-amino-7-oxononanoate synthase
MPSDVLSNWKAGLKKGLRALELRNQFRSLAEIHGVNFCSNDYLGLSGHPVLHEAVSRAVHQAKRIGGTGSRLLSGQTEEWHELEERFAAFAGTESALFFTTGYAANIGLLSSLVSKDDVIFSDALNHASLIDGMRLSGARKVIYPHLDLQVLEAALQQESGAPWRKVIITESVFSMDGDIAPIREIAALAEKYDAALILDEAHATAVHGPNGRGIAAQVGIVPQLLAVTHTCGKALGCAGAFVCGPAVLKEHLINHARTFIFSTALPSYFSQQITAALDLAGTMDLEREYLLKNAAHLIANLRAHGFNTAGSSSQIVPIVLGSNVDTLDAAEHLQRDGFAVRAIRPPTVPEGTSRLRLSLTTLIDRQELDRLVNSLIAWRTRQQSSVVSKHA